MSIMRKKSIVDQLNSNNTAMLGSGPRDLLTLFIQMVISQLLLNKIEWNKCHFVANLIPFQMNLNDRNPIVWFFL